MTRRRMERLKNRLKKKAGKLAVLGAAVSLVLMTGCSKDNPNQKNPSGNESTGETVTEAPLPPVAYVFVRDEAQRYALMNAEAFTAQVAFDCESESINLESEEGSPLVKVYRMSDYEVKNGWNMSVLTSEPTVLEDEDSLVYLFEFRDTLTWSDGTMITAEEYALAPALLSRGDFKGIPDGFPYSDAFFGDFTRYAGWKEYHEGTAEEIVSQSTAELPTFSGIVLGGKNTLIVSTEDKNTENVYSQFCLGPVPAKTWLPAGINVLDDGNGVFLSSAAKGTYMQEHFAKIVQDPARLGISAGELVPEWKSTAPGEMMEMKPGQFTGADNFFEKYDTVYVTVCDDCRKAYQDFVDNKLPSEDRDIDVYYQGK